MITKKLADLEIAIFEKKFDRAFAILVEVFGAVVAMNSGSPIPLIQWRPRKTPDIKTSRKRSDNDLVCDAVRIAALASNRVPESTGEMVCPKCGGKLVWNIHVTGRVWGLCSSDNCLTFME